MTEARYTPQTIYKALPDDQVATTGWREYFFEMAHAVVSGWGLVDQRAAQIMGLCVMADEAEDGLNRLTQQLQTVTERADEAERKLKGEQLSHGRTKKTVERLEKYIEELEQQVQEARDA